MNLIVPIIVYSKLYLWKLFHSLINYFFNLHIKKTYNINKNCYIFIKRIGKRSEILINYLNCDSNKFYKKLEFRFIKFTMSSKRQIPIFNVKNIDIEPCIFKSDTIINSFKIWYNSHIDSHYQIKIFNDLKNEFIKYIIFRINTIHITFRSFRVELSCIKVIKNAHKTRLYVTKIKVFYNNAYMCRIDNLKISHDSNTNNINIYGTRALLLISPLFLKFPIVNDIIDICNEFNGESSGKLPNIYFDEIVIQTMINNHIIFNLTECFFENNYLKFNAIVKIWKKEVFWIKKCSYSLTTNILSMNNVRIRLFKSTTDKIYKTFRPIYKLLAKRNTKAKRAKKLHKSSPDIHHSYNYSLGTDNIIDNNYFNTITPPVCPNKINVSGKYLPVMDNNYIIGHIDKTPTDLFKINKFTIDFQDNNGSFIFNEFIFSELTDGFHISCSKWQFIKNNIIYLDSVNQESKFIIEYTNNALLIYPYHLYLNLSIDDFANTFNMFTASIRRIVDIFNLNIIPSNSYIFDKFYVHSTRLSFSYNTKPIKMLRLLSGKYSELINTLDIHKLQFILKEITIIYPKNVNYIISLLIKHILDDVFKNNFDTLMKSTPISMTYGIKKKLSELPGFTNKCLNLLNINITSNN